MPDTHENTVLDWLLAGDPAIRWQALRDLTGAPAAEVGAERARVAAEGWGAYLLSVRDRDGQWAGGACFPHDFRWGSNEPQPWTATLPTLALLRRLGIASTDERVVETVRLVGEHSRWEHAGQRFWDGEVEPCINGQTLAAGAYVGAPVEGIAARLLGEQLSDGGWNCQVENGSTVSSFHTTICVLEGLREWELHGGGPADTVTEALRAGEEYLLQRRLFRRLSTGEIIDGSWQEFAFPVQWRYDVLRGLDHLAGVGDAPDPRAAEAVALVRDKQGADGRWPLDRTHRGATHLSMERDGEPSRWNTLRALRVLAWYDAGSPS